MSYRIISVTYHLSFARAVAQLTKEVSEAIAQGWEPLGGIATATGTIAQAMIKRR